MRFEGVDDLKTGIFRVRSAVAAGTRPATPPATGSAPRLEIASGTETGRVLAVRKPVIVLGRGTEADVRLTDTGVSRSHAELHLDPAGAVTIVDRHSTNGTTVNGRKVDSALLHDGDRIGLGASVLVFRQGG
ncbi:MAG: FHA domain-containing protein [Actinobacteria bacterium]|nr:FHA domain-containing protein [Actinomycetota bacterium]